MKKLLAFIPFAALALFPLVASHPADSPVCTVSSQRELVGVYPEHPLSPKQSLKTFDTVFLGEVVVPSRKCSLGFCAGIRVVETVKGKPGPTVLVRVAPAAFGTDVGCMPHLYANKGDRWMVFANQGTSKTGLKFLDSGTDGPSFAANKVPDFNNLEGQYRGMQAALDQAIGDKLR